jgi:hypothetical protein
MTDRIDRIRPRYYRPTAPERLSQVQGRRPRKVQERQCRNRTACGRRSRRQCALRTGQVAICTCRAAMVAVSADPVRSLGILRDTVLSHRVRLHLVVAVRLHRRWPARGWRRLFMVNPANPGPVWRC